MAISYSSNGVWPAEQYAYKNNPYNIGDLYAHFASMGDSLPAFSGYVITAFDEGTRFSPSYGFQYSTMNDNFKNPDETQGQAFLFHLVIMDYCDVLL